MQENFEVDLASSPREGSESPSNPFNAFRLHSKVQDGPLVADYSSREQSPKNVSKVTNPAACLLPHMFMCEAPDFPLQARVDMMRCCILWGLNHMPL